MLKLKSEKIKELLSSISQTIQDYGILENRKTKCRQDDESSSEYIRELKMLDALFHSSYYNMIDLINNIFQCKIEKMHKKDYGSNDLLNIKNWKIKV